MCQNYFKYLGIIVFGLLMMSASFVEAQQEQWAFPFPVNAVQPTTTDSMTLEQALYNVGKFNRSLEAGRLYIEGSSGLTDQAALWPNPELEFELEEFGGTLPGMSQSEWSLSVSQEFELWGKRAARKAMAESESNIIRLNADISAFDIYGDAKLQFFALLHIQMRRELENEALRLARNLAQTVAERVNKGAAHISEQYLAELEQLRLQSALEETKLELVDARRKLASFWGGNAEEVIFAKQTGIYPILPLPDKLLTYVDGSRDVNSHLVMRNRVRAKLSMVRTEARPNLSLSAGFRRLESDKVNTFLLGIAFPLPLFNRNQGQVMVLKSEAMALEKEMVQLALHAESEIGELYSRYEQAASRLVRLDLDLIPAAEKTYRSLRDAYNKGRLSYLVLLDGRRTLIELSSERNDTLFDIWREIIALEEILGMRFDNLLTD